jgi:beta-mannosidase
MKDTNLNGKWTMVYGTPEEKGILYNKKFENNLIGKSFDAIVPTTMYEVLENNNAIDDPFFGENEAKYTELSNISCSFKRNFNISKEEFDNDVIELCFDGLDTLSTIFLNGAKIAFTENMHLGYSFSVKKYLLKGINSIQVDFESPVMNMRDKYDRKPIWTTEVAMKGHSYLRKSHTQFGWDWGPQLPDMGIWKPVCLKIYNTAKIEDYYVVQKHRRGGKSVDLDISLDFIIHEFSKLLTAKIQVKDAENKVILTSSIDVKSNKENVKLSIENPKLWWPNNLGEQYLYEVSIKLFLKEEVMDSKNFKIGLRTLTLDQSPRENGRNFAFVCNGVEFFAMGANYIPQDALAARGENKEKLSHLLVDCSRVNYNCIRVWGGGTYASDYFYDECDRLGLVVWQDMMFACGIYDMSERFTNSVKEEIIYNVKRIRNHASLGLLCGNNEMEGAFVNSKGWGITRTDKLNKDYLDLYEKMIPDIMEKHNPITQYWPSSPSSIGGFNDPENDAIGDAHYWGVFHGNEHYKVFRNHYLRFASEYGMEALPDMKTIKQFTAPEDRSFLSAVMDTHNKVIKPYNGNIKVLSNIALEFKIPQQLDELSYVSQVFQAETIKIAVEHFRSNRGRCMGSTYWQVNDDYPVISWSSIDYYGRWKALHYVAKRFYSPVMLASREDGLNCHLTLCNERKTPFTGILEAEIRDKNSNVIESVKIDVKTPAFSATKISTISISKLVEKNGSEYNDLVPLNIYNRKEREYFVSFRLINNYGNVVSSGTQLFASHKYFAFKKADIKVVEGTTDNEIIITSNVFTKSIMLTTLSEDVIFDDNCFDLLPGENKVIKVIEGKFKIADLKIYCINNTSSIS